MKNVLFGTILEIGISRGLSMMMNNQHRNKQTAEKALALYEESEKEFQNHWVWKELSCQPEEFFSAVKKHVATLNISKNEWDATYKKAKEGSRIRSLEKRTSFKPINLQMMSALRV